MALEINDINVSGTLSASTLASSSIFSGSTDLSEIIGRNVAHTTLVKSISDFPSPVNSVIYLSADTHYVVDALQIDIGANSFVLPENFSCVITGINRQMSRLYSGEANKTVFSGTNVDLLIRWLEIEASGSGSKVFELNGQIATTRHVWIFSNHFFGCASIGSIEGYEFLKFSDNHMMNCYDGFTAGECEHVFLESNEFHDYVGTLGTSFNIPQGSFEVIKISDNYFEISSGYTAINIGTGVTLSLDSGGSVEGNVFHNFGGTILSGITTGDNLWEFNGNLNLADGRRIGSMFWSNNTTATSFSATGVYVNVAGATSAGTNIERFQMSGSNVLVYMPKTPAKGVVHVNGDVTVNTGNKSLTLSVSKNGTVDMTTTIDVRASSNPVVFSLVTDIELLNGDAIRLVVKNNTDATSCTVNDCNFIIM